MQRFVLWSVVLACMLSTVSVHATAYYADADAASDAGACTVGAKCILPSTAISKFTTAGDTLNLECGDVYRMTTTLSTPMAGTAIAKNKIQHYGTCVKLNGLATSGSSTVLNDTTAGFVVSGVTTGMQVFNVEDGSSCILTTVAATALTCSFPLRGGKLNTWTAGDRYYISNDPMLVHASLFNTGWTNQGSNVWSHAATNDPRNSVWVNRTNTGQQYYSGTCSVANLAGQPDLSFCWLSGNLYFRSNSDPATRWASPNIGVEAVHLVAPQLPVVTISSDAYWTMDGIHVLMGGPGATLLNVSSSNSFLLDNSRIGMAGFQFPSGSGASGGVNLQINGSSSNGTYQNSIIHDSGRNHIFQGGGTGAVQSNNSFINLTLVNALGYGSVNNCGGSSALCTNIIWRNNTWNHVCSAWGAGNQGATHNTFTLDGNFLLNGVWSTDARLHTTNSCGESRGISFDTGDTCTGITVSNNVVTGYKVGLRTTNCDLALVDRNVLWDNDLTGMTLVPNTAVSAKLTNNIFAGNGAGGTPSGTNHQIGCTNACSGVTFPNSDYNIFDSPSGTGIGYFAGVDTNMTVAEFAAQFGGNANSKDEAPGFADVAARNFSRTICDDGSSVSPFTNCVASGANARDIGAAELAVMGTPTVLTSMSIRVPFSYIQNAAALHACQAADFLVNVASGGNIAPTLATIIGANVYLTPSQTILGGQSVLVSAVQGACTVKTAGTEYLYVTADSEAVTNKAGTNNLPVAAPFVTGCTVSDSSKDKILVAVNTQGSSPLLPASPTQLTGCTARKAGVSWTVDSALVTPSGVHFELDMAGDAAGGNAIDITCLNATTNITNSALVKLANTGSNFACVNTVSIPPPTIESIRVAQGQPDVVRVTVSIGDGLALVPTTGMTGITVTDKTVVSCAYDAATTGGTSVDFTCVVTPVFAAGETKTATYSQGTGNITDGTSELVAFTGQAIVNEVQATPGIVSQVACQMEYPFEAEATARKVPEGNAVPGKTVQIRCEVCCTVTNCLGQTYLWETNVDGGAWTQVAGSFGGAMAQYRSNPATPHFTPTVTRLTGGALAGGVVYTQPGNFDVLPMAQNACAPYVLHADLSPATTLGQTIGFRVNTSPGGGVVYTVPQQTVNVTAGTGTGF